MLDATATYEVTYSDRSEASNTIEQARAFCREDNITASVRVYVGVGEDDREVATIDAEGNVTEVGEGAAARPLECDCERDDDGDVMTCAACRAGTDDGRDEAFTGAEHVNDLAPLDDGAP